MNRTGKNNILTLSAFILLTILFFFNSCKTGKFNSSDLNKITINSYYKGEISGKTLYVTIKECNEKIAGEYFFVTDKAITEVNSFRGFIKNGMLSVTGFVKNDSLQLFTEPVISEDTISCNFFLKNSKEPQTLILVREKPQAVFKSGNRYKSEVFSKVKKTTKIFGNAEGYYSSKLYENVSESNYGTILVDVAKSIAKNVLLKEHDLDLDIYEPVGDTLKKRPLIVLIHGGAFIIGDKKSETMLALSEYYARLGYVVASVNYRLGYLLLPGQYDYLEREIHRAVQDARAAIRNLMHNSGIYKIDRNRIIVGGNSAGGFTALNVAFMDESEVYPSIKGSLLKLQKDLGCLDCSSNNYKDKFSVKGVINMWGALTDIELMDDYENIPLLSFHGDDDNIVPYGFDLPFKNIRPEITAFFVKKIYGSKIIHEKASKLNLKNELVTFPKASHEPHLDENNQFNEKFDIIKSKTKDFNYSVITQTEEKIIGIQEISHSDFPPSYRFYYHPSYKYFWKAEGGKIVSISPNGEEIKIVWFDNSDNKKIILNIINDIGASLEFSMPVRVI